jgi:hypothetical protein
VKRPRRKDRGMLGSRRLHPPPQLDRTYIREPLRTLSLGYNTKCDAFTLGFANRLSPIRRFLAGTTPFSPLSAPAGLSGKGQNTEHGGGYGD